MTCREIIDLQLESVFGNKLPQKTQRLVDDELNQGRWVDGYDLAVTKGTLGGNDAGRLLDVILRQNPELRIDADVLIQNVKDHLSQSAGAKVLWIVDESGSFALTDSLRVARFDGASIVWMSPRISYDGIEFDSVSNGLLRGRAWYLSSASSPDTPFTFDFLTGELIDGSVV